MFAWWPRQHNLFLLSTMLTWFKSLLKGHHDIVDVILHASGMHKSTRPPSGNLKIAAKVGQSCPKSLQVKTSQIYLRYVYCTKFKTFCIVPKQTNQWSLDFPLSFSSPHVTTTASATNYPIFFQRSCFIFWILLPYHYKYVTYWWVSYSKSQSLPGWQQALGCLQVWVIT